VRVTWQKAPLPESAPDVDTICWLTQVEVPHWGVEIPIRPDRPTPPVGLFSLDTGDFARSNDFSRSKRGRSD